MDNKMTCRACAAALDKPFLDLGRMALANSYLKPQDLGKEEPTYPLRVFFCENCGLAQQLDFTAAGEVFDDYQYFSSFSQSWLAHSKNYVDMITSRLGLTSSSRVIEIASNDGYLLQYFKQKGIPCLGIEPSKTVAEAARAQKIETLVQFFNVGTGKELAEKGLKADLILGNNVLAHVPDLHDFVGGFKHVLKEGGVLTMEFPHLLRMMKETQFDTIYHEHFSYISLTAIEKVFAAHDIVLFDVEEIPTHGGSLRIYGRLAANAALPVSERIGELKARENANGLLQSRTYRNYAIKVEEVRRELLHFLHTAKAEGKTVAGYGAPAKGNTLLNFCGVGPELLAYTVDLSPHKQGRFLPGSHIPVYSPDKIKETEPDYILILPWNIKGEIMKQLSYVADWGGSFVTAVPELKVFMPERPASHNALAAAGAGI